MNTNLFDIRDRVVVITGGTGVLGREIGKYLAQQGAKVVLLGRRKDVGDALITDILALGGEAVFYYCDVMDVASVEAVCEKVMQRYGRVDALLNAAGGNMPGATITPTGTLFDVQVEEFQKVLNVNLTGTVIPTQVFLKPMVEAGRGAIVNFSSMAAFRPLTRVMGYAAAKAGISNFTAFLANEVASKFTPGIRVNAIAPGFFLTNQNRALLFNEDGTPTARSAKILNGTPMGRFVDSAELLGGLFFLTDDKAASAITGVVLPIDCGFAAYSGV